MNKTLSDLLEELARTPEVDPRGWVSPGVGSSLGRFDLLQELGRGGFGVVYEARDRELGRLVALKVIRPGIRSAAQLREQRLHREAEAVAQLSHPNIVTLHDLGTSEGGSYLIFERLYGETLQDRLARGPLTPREAVSIALEVARAMAHAHTNGVLHRDLKPSNVFLTQEGGVKVLDFGLAHLFDSRGVERSGTPAYMAPEQWRGEPEDARVDVFGLGVMLFEMLEGQLPYRLVDERSTVLHPGPTPSLSLLGVPPELMALVSSALSREPSTRPHDGNAMLDSLLEVKREYQALESAASGATAASGRRAGLRGVKGWTGLGLLLLGSVLIGRPIAERLIQGERIRVVVADFVNETGDHELDGLSGLLITSLEQSRRLVVVTRARMLDILNQVGTAQVARVDEALGRQVSQQAQAKALLLASIHRFDEVYSIEMKAVDPLADVYLFTLKEEGMGKSSIPAVIDRLSERARRQLREGEADVRASEVKVAQAVTHSLEAYQYYLSSQQCSNQTAYGYDCTDEMERVLAIDPTFALAHYQLALWMSERGVGTWARQRTAIDAAMRFADRVPMRQRELIRAWKQHFDGKDDEALATYQQMIATYPSEQQPLYEAGDLMHHRSDFVAAAPFFEKLLEIQPGNAWALDHWVENRGALRRQGDLESLVERWSAAPPTPATLHALCAAYGWLGDYATAVRTAQREAEAGGGLSAQQDLVYASIFAGAYEELRVGLSKLAASGGPARRFGYYALAAVDAYQGRRRSGLSRFANLISDLGVQSADAFFHSIQADYLVGDGDAGAVWAQAQQLLALDPVAASTHAVSLAYLGDLDHAAKLAPHLRPGTPRQQTYQALLLWHRGEQAQAIERLREIAARSPFDVDRGLAPAFLYGELVARVGADAEAVDALRAFQALYIPTAMWRSWAYPRSLYLMAVSLERLERHSEALAQVEKLLAQWGGADPDLALLKEARALGVRLAGTRLTAGTRP